MSKLDAVLERIRQLPQDRQDAIAVDLEFMLEDEEKGPLLTDEQWAELERRLADPNPDYIPHEEVVAAFLRQSDKLRGALPGR